MNAIIAVAIWLALATFVVPATLHLMQRIHR